MFPLYDHNPHRRFPLLTILLIVANVWVMWRVSLLSPMSQAELLAQRGFVPQRLTRIDDPQPTTIQLDVQLERGRRNAAAKPIVKRFELTNDSASVYASIFSTMFLHGGWLHLLTNMWMLWVFGNNIEDRLGHIVFVLFYLAGGIVATLAHWMVDPTSEMPLIGASGAVAAVLGGYALTFPWVKVKTLVLLGIPLIFDLPAFVVLSAWMLMETAFGVLQLHLGVVGGVAHWAHIGGFIAGLALMPILVMGRPPQGEDWNKEAEQLFKFEEPRPLTERE